MANAIAFRIVYPGTQKMSMSKRRFISLKWQIFTIASFFSCLLLIGLFGYWMVTLNRVTQLGLEEEHKTVASALDTIYTQWRLRIVKSVEMISKDRQLAAAVAGNLNANRPDVEKILYADRFLTGAVFLSVSPNNGSGPEVSTAATPGSPDFDGSEGVFAKDKSKDYGIQCDSAHKCWEVISLPVMYQGQPVGTLVSAFPFSGFFKAAYSAPLSTSIKIVGEHDALPEGWMRIDKTMITLPDDLYVAAMLPQQSPLDIVQMAITATVIGGAVVFLLIQVMLVIFLFDRFAYVKKLLVGIPIMLDKNSEKSDLVFHLARGGKRRVFDELDLIAQGMVKAHYELHKKPSNDKTVSDDTARLMITEYMAEERKQLLARFAKAEEEMRQQLARDLHDEVGGRLVSMKVDLTSIKRYPGLPAEILERVTRFEGNCLALNKFLHLTMEDLSPSIVSDFGLKGGVKGLVDEWQANLQEQTEFSLVLRGDLHKLPLATAMAAYRIVQEALTNIAKHARAKHVKVDLSRTLTKVAQDSVVIDITDDGVGFDLASLQYKSGSRGRGLQGIRERAEGFGGSAQIDSTPGSGVHIHCLLPIVLERAPLNADTLNQLYLKKEAD